MPNDSLLVYQIETPKGVVTYETESPYLRDAFVFTTKMCVDACRSGERMEPRKCTIYLNGFLVPKRRCMSRKNTAAAFLDEKEN